MKSGAKDVFAVASKHRPDLPKLFDERLQEWAQSTYSHLKPGESKETAGKMVYKPNDEIVDIRV